MPSVAVTVVGHDRPGIVHRVTAVIAALQGNLEDTSMSLLRGHFAMTLIADLPDQDAASRLDEGLVDLRAEQLTVSVFEVSGEEITHQGVGARLSVHGADRPGIVEAATHVVAAAGGNITDLTTRLGASLYVLTADVVFPAGTKLSSVVAQLLEAAAPLGVQASLVALDEDLL